MKRKIVNFIIALALTVLLLVCLAACGGVHTVTYLAAEGGYIEGDSVQNVKHGKDGVEVTAIPYTDYIFIGWSDGVAEASRKEQKVKANYSLTAMFAKAQLTLKYSAGEGGEIAGKTEQVVDYGKDAEQVIAVSQTGYKFVGWSDGYKAVERQDFSVKSEIDVHALFEKETFIAEYLAAGGGVIKGEDTQKVAYGDYTAEVTAVPKNNYLFVGWSDGLETPERSDYITGSLLVTAQFKADDFLLKYIAGEGGSIEGKAEQRVIRGRDGEFIEAVPNKGYVFDGWTDGYPRALRKDFNVTSNRVITARFREAVFNLKYTHDEGGSIIGETNQIVRLGQDASPVTAVPDKYHYFNMWNDHSKQNPRQDLNVNSDITINAIFLPKTFTIRYSATEGGRIDGDTLQSLYYGTHTSSVDAVADDAYEFVGWSDGKSESHRWDRSESDVEYTAIFRRKVYSVKYGCSVGGKIMGDSDQTLYWGEDATTVTAIADEGYEFLNWSDGVTSATRNDFGIKWNVDARATFAPIGQQTYKVLLIFVTDLKATLKNRLGEMVDVDYTMTDMERTILAKIPSMISGYLNDVFGGEVNFIVDGYFTTETVRTESMWYTGPGAWTLFGHDIPEVKDMAKDYRSYLTFFCMNDSKSLLHKSAGSAGKQNGFIYLETLFSRLYDHNSPLDVFLDYSIPSTVEYWKSTMRFLIHEFIHTLENNWDMIGSNYIWHEFLAEVYKLGCDKTEGELIPYYLRGGIKVGDKVAGIPRKFWTDKYTFKIEGDADKVTVKRGHFTLNESDPLYFADDIAVVFEKGYDYTIIYNGVDVTKEWEWEESPGRWSGNFTNYGDIVLNVKAKAR